MDLLSVLLHETKSSYAWLENLVSDITHDQANWKPPGTANSIAATYAHAIISADVDLNRHFHGRTPIIAGARAQIVGLGELFPDDFSYEGDIRWAELHEYGLEVQACVATLVDALTLDDLNRSFEMVATADGEPISLGTWKGIDICALHGSNHIKMHGGEIACLKGLQGLEGYRPFSGLYP